MKKLLNFQYGVELALLLIAFCLPLFPKALPPLIALLVLFWLFMPKLKERLSLFLGNKPALLLSSFYILHLIGLLYSSNMQYGLKDSETKLSLFIFPVLFSSFNVQFDIKKIFRFFILGCSLAAVSCFFYAGNLFFFHGINRFFYTEFSLFIHPAYFAAYLNLAIMALIIRNFQINSFKKQLLNYFLILFFSVTIIFLSSKMGIICLAFPFILGIFHIFFIQRKHVRAIIVFILITFTLYFSFWNFLKDTRFGSIMNIKNSVQFKEINLSETDSVARASINYENIETSQIRYIVWNESLQIIKKNLVFGVGSGDIKDELLKRYSEKKMGWIFENKMNAHNQFLQTAGALGIFGLFIFFAGLVIAFYYCIKKKEMIFFNFLVILILNFLVESMLETQAGVIFFSFFISLFCFNKPDEHL